MEFLEEEETTDTARSAISTAISSRNPLTSLSTCANKFVRSIAGSL